MIHFTHDSGEDYVSVEVFIPAYGTVVIDFTNRADYTVTNDEIIVLMRKNGISVFLCSQYIAEWINDGNQADHYRYYGKQRKR